jgi:hypothetical protein
MLTIFYSPFVYIRYIKETGRILVQKSKNPYANPSEEKEVSLEEFCADPNYSLYHLTALMAAGRKAALVA